MIGRDRADEATGHRPVSSRRRLASLRATAAIVAILALAVALVARRALDLRGTTGEIEVRPSDGFIVLAVLVAITVIAKIFTQTRAPSRFVPIPSGLRSRLRRLVETSYFGVGSLPSWTATNPAVGLDRLVMPADLSDLALDDVPEPAADVSSADSPNEHRSLRADALPGRSRRDPVPLGELVEHLVTRGETLWSLAETTLGDGRRWFQIRDANVGRYVTPQHRFREDDILVPGWSVLIPNTRLTDVGDPR